MNDYKCLLMVGALCLAGCSSEPSSGMGGLSMGGAGAAAPVSGSVAPPPPAGASAGATAAGMSGAAAGAAGASGAAAGSSGAGVAGMSAAGASGAAAGSSGAGTAGMSAAAGSGGAAGGSSTGAFKAVFDTLEFGTTCASCHRMGSVFGSPDFSTLDTAYASLVDKDASTMAPGMCGGMGKLVTPGNCETSLIYNKLTQSMPKCGRRMPLSSDAMPQILPQASIDALCAWIKAGAKK